MRGAGRTEVKHQIRDLVRNHNLDILIFMEPMLIQIKPKQLSEILIFRILKSPLKVFLEEFGYYGNIQLIYALKYYLLLVDLSIVISEILLNKFLRGYLFIVIHINTYKSNYGTNH